MYFDLNRFNFTATTISAMAVTVAIATAATISSTVTSAAVSYTHLTLPTNREV